jgi:hypothetical protein
MALRHGRGAVLQLTLTFHRNFGSGIHVFAEDYRLIIIIKNKPNQQHFNLQHFYERGNELLHIYRQGKQYVIDIMDLLGQAGGLGCDIGWWPPIVTTAATSIYQSMNFTKPQT